MLSLFRITLCAFTCLIFTGLTFGQLCNTATSCMQCIQLVPASCVWCAQANYSQPNQRCVERMSQEAEDCTMIEDPEGSSAETQPAADFGGNDFVQVSPQRFSLSLRPGQPQTIRVGVRPANNFPVDIYYLMDQSFSMNDDLQNLQTLASTLASTISNITTNFQLGFGSFVDKELVPYISVETQRLSDPCREPSVDCERTYNTRHSLRLTNNAGEFSQLIQEETISGNLDSPEGGFDALLQVIVCTDIIGWRPNARHIIVFLTDAGFHFAGDGKLGGVVIPNDGQCHLEQFGSTYRYTMSTQLDYPSIGQINTLLQENDIIPIFAAEARAAPLYNSLKEVITGAFVENLAGDSRNIVDLIRNTYNTISQTVRLDPDDVDGITVSVTANCPSGIRLDGICTGVLIEETAFFNVTVTAERCSEELQNGQDVVVRIPGFGQFLMQLTGVCDCNCSSQTEENSTFCNFGNGSLVCGQCECNEGWVGDTCECSTSSITSTDCPVGANNETCTSSERGTCVCSTCACNEVPGRGMYFGPACECDDFSCDVDSRGLVCGGPLQGTCGCDQRCTCRSGWTGPACDCTTETETCEQFGEVCSGASRGICSCGECICNQTNQLAIFSGETCQICIGTECPPNPECIAFEDCAICQTAPNGQNCSDVNCTAEAVGGVMNTATFRIEGTQTTTFCRVSRGDCDYQYFVGARDEEFVVAVMEADCSSDGDGVEPWIIIVAILGGLILLAIIVLVIIRIIIELRYCVEFRQWKKELERARFAKNDNPLFQKATEDFLNPAYGK